MPYRPTRRTVLHSATLLAAGAAIETVTGPLGATAATLEIPETLLIPVPQEWTPAAGTYFFQSSSRLVVDTSYAGQLTTAAATLSDDLFALTGIRFTPVNDTAANAGDVFLTLGSTDTRLGDEGYLLTIGQALRIQARTATGAFFGTRTFLQMLRRSARMQYGTIRDWPRYRERGFLASNAPVKLSMGFWQQQIRELSYLKMNMITIVIGVPNAPVNEIQQIAEFARRYFITVVPMFGMPSHMDYFMGPDRPQVPGRPTDLHIGVDAAYTWARGKLEPLVTAIPSPWFHSAADEFLANSTVEEWERNFGAYARAHYGPNAHPFDAFDGFINFENQIVRSAGRTMRVWNDTIYAQGIVSIDRNVVIEHWIDFGRRPADLLADGYQLQNSHIDFTYYDVGGSHQLDPARIYEQFRIGQFHGSAVSDDHPGLLGSKLHVWTTFPPLAESEAQIAAKLMAPERSFAQVLWGSPKQAANYAGFAPIITAVGRAPGITVADPTAPTMRSVVTANGAQLFGIAPDGHVMTTSWSAAGWNQWSSVKAGHYHGRTAPNAAVTVLGDDLFTTAPDGRVITTRASGGGWREWFTIAGAFSDGKTAANAVVSATVLNGNVQLFTTAPDGQVMSSFRSGTDGWSDWFPIPTGFYDGKAAAGSGVTATGSQIYAIAPDGHVMSTFWSPGSDVNGGWHAWFAIPTGLYDGRTAANAAVSVGTVNNHTHLFTLAPDGHVMTTFWDPVVNPGNGGWHEWFAIPTGHADGRAAANTAVTATTVNGNAQLFTVAADGYVMSTFWHRDITTNGGWHEWFAIPTGVYDGKAAAHSRVGFANVNGNPQLFTTSPDRHVGSTFWNPAVNPGNGGWSGWFAIPGGYADGRLRG